MDGVRLEDLCGLLALDEEGVLSEAGVQLSKVPNAGEPLTEIFVSQVIRSLGDFLAWRGTGFFTERLGQSEVVAYTMAADVDWVALSSSGDWRLFRRVCGPLKYFDCNAGGRASRSWFSETKFDVPGRRGQLGFLVRSMQELGSVQVSDYVCPAFVAFGSYKDVTRPTLLERILRVYLLLAAEPHDANNVRSLWTELCLLEPEV